MHTVHTVPSSPASSSPCASPSGSSVMLSSSLALLCLPGPSRTWHLLSQTLSQDQHLLPWLSLLSSANYLGLHPAALCPASHLVSGVGASSHWRAHPCSPLWLWSGFTPFVPSSAPVHPFSAILKENPVLEYLIKQTDKQITKPKSRLKIKQTQNLENLLLLFLQVQNMKGHTARGTVGQTVVPAHVRR